MRTCRPRCHDSAVEGDILGPKKGDCLLQASRRSETLVRQQTMGHAAVDNGSAHAGEHLFLCDEDGRSLLVVLVQATFDLVAGKGLVLAETQIPPSLTGELNGADARVSSYRIEPAFAFTKPGTDVVLLGHAQAPGGRSVTELPLLFRVGPVGKALRVVGDRQWVKSGGLVVATPPRPFERIPLLYERAFGGWDRSEADPARHSFEARNPVGRGFRAPNGLFEEGVALPNLEDPADVLLRHGQAVTPAGTGFTSPDWQARAALAGTYDEAWARERSPLLPRDFDRRFFNAASPGLVADPPLVGNEPVVVENASPLGRLSFRLPGVQPPACRVELARRGDLPLALALDTVIVDSDHDRVLMLYRGHLPLRDGPHDVLSIELRDQARVVSGYTPSPRAGSSAA
jgi:hypothetical protein